MAAVESGYGDEADRPHDPAGAGVKPPPEVYAGAAARKVDKARAAYLRTNGDHLVGCLAALALTDRRGQRERTSFRAASRLDRVTPPE